MVDIHQVAVPGQPPVLLSSSSPDTFLKLVGGKRRRPSRVSLSQAPGGVELRESQVICWPIIYLFTISRVEPLHWTVIRHFSPAWESIFHQISSNWYSRLAHASSLFTGLRVSEDGVQIFNWQEVFVRAIFRKVDTRFMWEFHTSCNTLLGSLY